eukprot:TRINITY_DN1994_c1_g1_i1.p1 TRINITY_DN1994_c1_g1~~TRINITY_DN1994_c1_g1_i1.p1  ORF type:complete len:741 (-),score=98.35 TRINITY_DN1994_c1_g1_i1:39-2180(-)
MHDPYQPPPPPQAPGRWRAEGDWVQIAGLQGRPELNGQRCRVLHWDASAGRFAVAIENTGEQVKVKESNLVEAERVLVTVVSGLTSPGKASLVQHVLAESIAKGMKTALIVGHGAEHASGDAIVRLSGGSQWSSLQLELATEIINLALTGKFSHILIEAPGHAQPRRVAELFRFGSSKSQSTSEHGADHSRQSRRLQVLHDRLQACAELDTMVSVIDGTAILHQLMDDSLVAAEDADSMETEQNTVAHLVARHIEFCDVIVIDKCDQLATAQAADVKQLIHMINPEAGTQFVACSEVPVSEILGRGAYMWKELRVQQRTWRWLKEGDRGLNMAATSSTRACTSACCVPSAAPSPNPVAASFSFKPERPFHPGRLAELLAGRLHFPPSVVRVSGSFWLASRPSCRGIWSTVGSITEFREGHPWWAGVPRARWPEALRSQLEQEGLLTSDAQWCSTEHGDCHSELTVVGHGLVPADIKAFLAGLTLTGPEYAEGAAAWALYEDSLPAWSSTPDPNALSCLALRGTEGILEALCLQRADPNACNDFNGGTALHAASLKSRERSVRALLKSRADGNAVAQRGLRPLHLASSGVVVQLLCEHMCDVEARDTNGHAPLHHTACLGSVDAVSALLTARANVNALTSGAETPLHLAIINAGETALQVVQVLCAARADLELKNGSSGLDAFSIACQSGRADLMQVLTQGSSSSSSSSSRAER